VAYHAKLRSIDCKELSVLIHSPRVFTLLSVIFSQLWAKKSTKVRKVTYRSRLRLMHCKELSPVRLEQR